MQVGFLGYMGPLEQLQLTTHSILRGEGCKQLENDPLSHAV